MRELELEILKIKAELFDLQSEFVTVKIKMEEKLKLLNIKIKELQKNGTI